MAKNIYVCIKLGGPESITVRTVNLDDSFIAQNILQHYAEDIPYEIYSAHHDNMHISDNWLKAIEKSTDIIVFGNEDTVKMFRDYETVDRRVWEYQEKFSFGIARADQLTIRDINNICFDFFSFYGEGRLAPKFYFILGDISKKLIKQFSENMIALYRPFIEEYRNKLPFTKKSDLTQQYLNSNYKAYYIRQDVLNSEEFSANLYGDVRLIQVDDVDEIKDFISKWRDSISTVAINIDDDWEVIDMLDDAMIDRICYFGDMQFPEFFEQYETLDDFNIYIGDNSEEEYDDPFSFE